VDVVQSDDTPEVGDDVTVTAHVTDNLGVDHVDISYGGVDYAMTLNSGDALDGYWVRTIPDPGTETTITYTITAVDLAELPNEVTYGPHSVTWTDITPPVITDVTNNPEPPLIPGEPTIVQVTATDDVGVHHVTISYGGVDYAMALGIGDLWTHTIPGQDAGTSFSVTVTAYDAAGNTDTASFDKWWPIIATLDIEPTTLSLSSTGNWVSAFVELPAGYDVTEVDLATVTLEGVPAENTPLKVRDHDHDGNWDVKLKFNRGALIETLSLGDAVEVTIIGQLNDGKVFMGTTTIRVTL
jgi:hypothetical protein